MSSSFHPGLLVWLLPLPALLALALTTFNALFWPRGRRGAPDVLGRVSVCIPARNEAVSIRACVEAARRLGAAEVVVVDDGSTDATPAILDELARTPSTTPLRVVRVDEPLDPGWVGKPRACARLTAVATGDSLLFLDADVVADPSLLARVAGFVEDLGAEAVTAVPRQLTGSFFEELVLPLLHVTYTSWLPLPLVWRTHDERFLAANGQILWITRPALVDVGGWEAVKNEIVDDMALCRALKRARRRVVFADGHAMGSCRMYRSARAVFDGFSKNLFEGIGGHWLGLLVVLALYGSAFVLPWVLLGAAALVPAFVVPAAVGALAGWGLRLLHVVRHGSTVTSALLHPVGVVVLLAIAVRSWRWTRRGTIRWAGRIYAGRATRLEMAG
jgi:chlorobactene glucosyltransferase